MTFSGGVIYEPELEGKILPTPLCYESLNDNSRLVLSDRGFKQLSDPNANIIYHGNLLFLTMGIMYLLCELLSLTALVWQYKRKFSASLKCYGLRVRLRDCICLK